ncbi:MAG: histidine phosphatase family protein [Lachnospiraceae bacterium]|nr:histidine phosphatase family protein [Lachnospiraceae bacterium]
MLYIIRHGRTDWNDLHKLQGRTDVPLNESGRSMAREAAVKYRDVHFDICYCSPLVRAKQTAEILLEGRDVPIVFDDRLKEMSFGSYEGIENSFAIPDCPINVFFKDPAHYTDPPGGAESIDDLFKRTGEFLEELVYPKIKEGRDVLIVGHGAMNSSIVCRIMERTRDRFWEAGIENCVLKQLI